MKKIFALLPLVFSFNLYAQNFKTRFENSNGTQSATYFECIDYYKRLGAAYKTISVKTMDTTDAGYPLNLIFYSNDGVFNPDVLHKKNKIVILINNGIHPGEPDGIDACMMLLRDLAQHKIKAPDNVALAVIPVYNIGGSLNRTPYSRVNQNGPEEYGFRGNAQNYDLNRDFIKSDSKNARAFASIFHYVNPDIFIDNHVSDGADFQHTMTLLTTVPDKLGYAIGKFLRETFEPALFKGMSARNWQMVPYVNFEVSAGSRNWDAYFDSPRYGTGYAALFETISFMPETHMLKPYKQRVQSVYDLMITMMEQGGIYAKNILEKRKESIDSVKRATSFPLGYKIDTTRYDNISFMGYAAEQKKSDVTGMDRLFYNHDKPYTAQIKFYDYFTPEKFVAKPKAYIIPQGWWKVLDLLKLNKVAMTRLAKDSVIEVDAYRVEDYTTATRNFEGHYMHSNTKLSTHHQSIKFLKGDYIIYTGQAADRFLAETLEPEADDSYFSWNFFDQIFQQKEGYSNYRWEDVAGTYLQAHPEIRKLLEDKKKEDPKFAANANAQLNFVYQHSPYYEPAHLRYPVYKVK
ncbi:MAG: M14 family metallopeptidase [Chitinophagaceae bacterium]|jgi:hypothetical protein|nr:M14 family metallopeptidase [Chitinophagaceae bacterium]